MKKYEYKIIYQLAEKKGFMGIGKEKSDQIITKNEAMLNQMGQQGWKLMTTGSIAFGDVSYFTYNMMREIA